MSSLISATHRTPVSNREFEVAMGRIWYWRWYCCFHDTFSACRYTWDVDTWSSAPAYQRYIQGSSGPVGRRVLVHRTRRGQGQWNSGWHWSKVSNSSNSNWARLTAQWGPELLQFRCFPKYDAFHKADDSNNGRGMIPRHWWRCVLYIYTSIWG